MSSAKPYASKLDGNHAEIAALFEELGCSVQPLTAVGGGCPDLLLGIDGANVLVEVKDGSLPFPSDRQLNPKQKQWHAVWKGKAHVVENAAQAIDIFAFYSKSKRIKLAREEIAK